MKKISVLIIALMGAVVSLSSQSGIQFVEGSWAELLVKAKEGNKLLFIDAYTTWCGPCKKMAADVFPDPKAGEYFNSNFVPVKLDMEKGEGLAIAKLYNVRAYPTFLFVNWKGEQVHRGVGGLKTDGLIELGRVALDDEKNLKFLEKNYLSDVNDLSKVLPYATALRDCYDMTYNEVITIYISSIPIENLKTKEGWGIISIFIEDPESDAFKYFVANKDVFTQIAGAQAVEEKLDEMVEIMISKALRKKNAQDIEDLRGAIKKIHPDKSDYFNKILNVKYQRSSSNWIAYGYAVMDLLAQYPESDGRKINNYGWDFYLHVEDKKLLSGMIKHVEKVVKVSDSYPLHDTYASLLYKTKNYKKALKEANIAVSMAEKEKIPYEETLELIRQIEESIKK